MPTKRELDTGVCDTYGKQFSTLQPFSCRTASQSSPQCQWPTQPRI